MNTSRIPWIRDWLLVAMLLTGPPFVRASLIADEVSPAEARETAKEAYIYGFSMLENYNTIYKQVGDPSDPSYIGGLGKYKHYSEPFTPDNHDVVTPNNDTPYSWAWMDLRAEPYVITVPNDPEKRYYVIQLVDLYTFNFGYIGVRSTGFDAGSYLIAGPAWKGATPPGIKKVFHAETDIVGSLTRTALNGAEDVPNVQAFQAKLKLESLSAFLGQPPPAPAPAIEFPPYDKARAQTHDFIAYLNFLLQFCQPPHPSEKELWAKFAKIGIGPGVPFDATKIDPQILQAIDEGVKDGQKALADRIASAHSSNGLFGTREFQQNDYLKRATGAAMGLYGNSLEEAWYGGYIGDGSKPSLLRFPKGKFPPAKFFWSITLYTLPDRFLYANSINRYSVGDRTKGLKTADDGSLTIYLSHDSPDADKESNWLPTPAGPYSLVCRIYGPSKAAMEGEWKLPALEPYFSLAPPTDK